MPSLLFPSHLLPYSQEGHTLELCSQKPRGYSNSSPSWVQSPHQQEEGRVSLDTRVCSCTHLLLHLRGLASFSDVLDTSYLPSAYP